MPEGVSQFADVLRSVMLACGIFGNLDESVFAAEVASRVRFYRHHDDAVHDGFGLLGAAQRGIVIGTAGGIAAVGNEHQDPPSIAAHEGLRTQEDCVVERGARATRKLSMARSIVFKSEVKL